LHKELKKLPVMSHCLHVRHIRAPFKSQIVWTDFS